LHWASLLALPETTKWLLDISVRTEQATFLGHPIHCAAAGLSGALSVLGEILPEGPEDCADYEDQIRVIDLLVQYGAHVNLSGLDYSTPIQLAFHSDYNNGLKDWPVTTALLKVGAAVERDFWVLRKYQNNETFTIDDDNERSLLNKVSNGAFEILDKD
jgi:hypothetical protein